jgi:hypothetical protein
LPGATAVLEKALAEFSDLVRVDKTGYDFIWEDETGKLHQN